MTALTEIPITSAARRGLEEAGFTSLEDLAARSREEVSSVRGVGAAALAVIERELVARGLAFGTVAADDAPTKLLDAAEAPTERLDAADAPVEPAETAVGTEIATSSINGNSGVEPVETPVQPTVLPAEPQPGYNPLAIVALVLLLAFPPASIVLGHIALGQLKRTPQKGRELALLATVLGYVFTGVALLAILIWLTVIVITLVVTFGAFMGAVGSLGDVGGMAGMPLPVGPPAR